MIKMKAMGLFVSVYSAPDFNSTIVGHIYNNVYNFERIEGNFAKLHTSEFHRVKWTLPAPTEGVYRSGDEFVFTNDINDDHTINNDNNDVDNHSTIHNNDNSRSNSTDNVISNNNDNLSRNNNDSSSSSSNSNNDSNDTNNNNDDNVKVDSNNNTNISNGTTTTTTAATSTATTTNGNNTHSNEPKVGGKKKKPRKKKNNKESSKKISWGNVEQILFTRALSSDTVPTNGSYPLGLGQYEMSETGSLDEYLLTQQMMLIMRARSLGTSTTNGSSSSNNSNHTTPHKARSNSMPDSNPLSPIRKPRSNSVTNNNTNNSTSSFNTVTEDNTSSFNTATESGFKYLETRQWDFRKGIRNPLFSALSEEERLSIIMSYNTNKINAIDISQGENSILADINRDLKIIRQSRHDKGGCSCKPLKIDKLSVTKMKSELKNSSYGATLSSSEIEAMNKQELTAKLREVLKDTCLCATSACECFVLGVECSDSTCLCVGKGRVCSNPSSYYVFNDINVSLYRKQILHDVIS